jgi:hypothetical protein
VGLGDLLPEGGIGGERGAGERGGRDQMKIPPLIHCPYCEPGPYSYAGKVIAVVCRSCREAIAKAER